MMKRLCLAMALLFSTVISFSQYKVQSKYFVYLQTEPAQPFYIKIDRQQISANSSGYLILPQLNPGNYQLTVGFPQEKYPEQNFNFVIDSKDKGYLIKKFDDGWSLFDLQTMAVQKPIPAGAAVAVNKPKEEPKKETIPAENVSDFTKVLSKAANDPGLLEKPKPAPVEEKPKPKPEEVTVAEKPVPKPADAAIVSKEPVTNNQQNSVEQKAEQPKYVNSAPVTGNAQQAVVKVSETTSPDGTTIVYEDRSGSTTESVKITIPQKNLPPPSPTVAPSPDTQKESTEKAETAAVQTEKENNNVVEKPAETPVVKPSGNCAKVATDDDFIKLRRSMAQQDNDDGMIEYAKSAFKSKCYTTAQIKYLSSMFLSNAGKYNFYEAAYAHVADPENFSSLQAQLKDQYYNDKFSKLIKQ